MRLDRYRLIYESVDVFKVDHATREVIEHWDTEELNKIVVQSNHMDEVYSYFETNNFDLKDLQFITGIGDGTLMFEKTTYSRVFQHNFRLEKIEVANNSLEFYRDAKSTLIEPCECECYCCSC